MLKIKICGLTRSRDIQIVNELLPDYIGFVFASSKRQVTPQQASKLKKLLRPEVKAVGVFVNAPIEQVVELVKSRTIDIVQLHGDEDASYCQSLRQKIMVPIIKVIRLRNEASLENMDAFDCDYFLFDTYVTGQYGGSGRQIDVSILKGREFTKPYFIAGGLNLQNVKAVLAEVTPFAVDVSGGVETDGVKDKKKIADFIKAVRGRSEDDEQNTEGI